MSENFHPCPYEIQKGADGAQKLLKKIWATGRIWSRRQFQQKAVMLCEADLEIRRNFGKQYNTIKNQTRRKFGNVLKFIKRTDFEVKRT